MLPISVCIIGKNEEKFLDGCLSHLTKYDFEIVFVDTGSTDKTKEIAYKYTDCVYDFEWIKDFSAARNFAATKATKDWILCVDCDEFTVFIPKNISIGLIRFTSNWYALTVSLPLHSTAAYP